MSYDMVVTYRCANCPNTQVQGHATIPDGWGRAGYFPTDATALIFGDDSQSPHYCPECIKARDDAGRKALEERRR